MGFNFPNTPSPGDIYQPVGGPSYTWDAQKWVMTGSPLQVTPAYSQRNRVVNPGMQISQENGNTVMTVTGAYLADQWLLNFTGITTVAGSRSITVVTPDNSSTMLSTYLTTARPSLSAGDYWFFQQNMEGIRVADLQWGTATAKQAVLRFNFFNGLATPSSGTFGVGIRNAAANRSWVGSFVAPTGWSKQTFVIPGDTTGTWPKDNTQGLVLNVTFACGATLTASSTGWSAGNFIAPPGMSNGAGAVNNSFYVADVGLYLDPTASGIPPRWEMPDEAQELIACQRYWAKTFSSWSGNTTSGTIYYTTSFLPVTMRTAPSLTGVAGAVGGFPAAVGALGMTGVGIISVQENRTANATGNGSVYQTIVAANSRM